MDAFNELFKSYKCLESCRDDILETFYILRKIYENDGKVLVCGNGGSASDCEHIVGELMKGFKQRRPVPNDFKSRLVEAGAGEMAEYLQGALPAISLVSQTSLITAFSNDICYEYAFAQQVYGYGKEGDALIAISTSGNAKNILNACYAAKAKDMYAIGLTGETGGALANICDVCIRIPLTDTAAVQEKHLPVYHAVCAALEAEFFK